MFLNRILLRSKQDKVHSLLRFQPIEWRLEALGTRQRLARTFLGCRPHQKPVIHRTKLQKFPHTC